MVLTKLLKSAALPQLSTVAHGERLQSLIKLAVYMAPYAPSSTKSISYSY